MDAPTAERYRIVALHGFLGAPDDWIPLRMRMPGIWWSPLDLWAVIGRRDVRDWASLGLALKSTIAQAVAAEPVLPTVVLAYSFGARLMLSVPRAAAFVRGTCLVSCNPGFAADDDDARAARRVSDEAWAQRLLDWDPQAIAQAWNRQPALVSSDPLPERPGLPADRAILAKAMRLFSLAGQPDWSIRIRQWPGPVLLVAGARDNKYAEMAGRLDGQDGNPSVAVVPGAGHRVPWDAPERFIEVFSTWAERLISRSRA